MKAGKINAYLIIMIEVMVFAILGVVVYISFNSGLKNKKTINLGFIGTRGIHPNEVVGKWIYNPGGILGSYALTFASDGTGNWGTAGSGNNVKWQEAGGRIEFQVTYLDSNIQKMSIVYGTLSSDRQKMLIEGYGVSGFNPGNQCTVEKF